MKSIQRHRQFWRPQTNEPGSLLDEERKFENEGQSTSATYNRYLSLSVEQQRQKLPIFQFRNHILYLLQNYQTVVIVGETGCGKSTQIPQYLLEAGFASEGYVIGVTQPRRVAVVTIAKRVAEEKGLMLGTTVGYTIRFEDCSDPLNTRIKFMTDGILIHEMMSDPLLKKYSIILLDEAHERNLNTDIVIGLLYKIMKMRKDLKVIVASATLNCVELKNFFNKNNTSDKSKDTATILSIKGAAYPVNVHYSLNAVPDYLRAATDTVMKIHISESEGDILVFLTGQEEVDKVVHFLIEEAKQLKSKQSDCMKMKVLPMHGTLPASEQLEVFKSTSKRTRKIIVATNIAEASITIDGIVYVVDCGFVKIKAYHFTSGIESLVTVPVSKASAKQRAGRAGRLRAGKVFRLYTDESFQSLPQASVPEIQRSDLAPVILQLKALGIANVLRFPFLSRPPGENMIRGLELLHALGALDDNCNLTYPLGFQMADFPLLPMFAKMLLFSGKFECSEEATIIAAMTQIQNIFVTPTGQKALSRKMQKKFAVEEGDHITLVNVYKAFIRNKQNSKWCHKHFLNFKGLKRAMEIRNQLIKLLQKFCVPLVSCGDNTTSVRKCITSGFFSNAAYLHCSGCYKTVRDGHSLYIHPTSILSHEVPPQWIVFNEVVRTTNDYMRDITVIQPEWLPEVAPNFYKFKTESELKLKKLKTY